VSLHLDRAWVAPEAGTHGSPTNPLTGLYRTADDRYLSLVMLQPTRFWGEVCRHLYLPELADDPRFATAELIAANIGEAVKLLREAVATRTLAEWAERFTTLSGPWAPVQDTLQLREDGQVQANEYLVHAGDLDLVASPVQFDVHSPELAAAPEFAAQTEEILTELGLDWDRIIALKAAGAVT
jgi:crotonobetainyl-CoA:carnitine CoA-transferase CaiB-like acyl-CoA transferase